MSEADDKSMPQSQQVFLGVGMLFLFVVLVTGVLAWSAGIGPSDDRDEPVIVDPEDDRDRRGNELERIAEDDAMKFAQDVQECYRSASRANDRRRTLRAKLPNLIHDHCFRCVMDHFRQTPYADYPQVMLDIEPGFDRASDQLRRMRHSDTSEAVIEYLHKAGALFTFGAKHARDQNEDRLHEWLRRNLTLEGQRLIDNLCDGSQPQYGLGWLFEKEHREELLQTSHPIPLLAQWAADAPEEINPRNWHRIENQGQMGSCFPMGTMVTMSDGSLRPIEEIETGDKVLSHKGVSRRVVATMQRKFTGNLITVFAKGWGKLTMTEDHVVMVVRDNREQWVRADGILEDDLMVVSRGVAPYSSQFADLANYLDLQHIYVDGDWISTKASHRTKRVIPLDDLACYAIGLYVAEGSVGFDAGGHACRASWTLHQDEHKEAEAVRRWAESLGLTAIIQTKTDGKAVDVRVSSTVLAEFLQTICGRFCNHKQVPEFILRGSHAQKMAFLRGYFDGDGALGKFEGERQAASGNVVTINQIYSSTASRILAQQVSTLMVSLGMKPGRTISPARSHQNHDAHQVYLYSVDAGLLMDKQVIAGKSRKVRESDSGQCRTIREITREAVENYPVYDFTVDEDHSFVAEGLVVHNCQGHALSSVCEYAYHISTNGKIAQFSPIFAYLDSQTFDRIIGQDRGSTLAGGLASALQHGACPLQVMPYPNPVAYPRPAVISQRAYDAAKPFKLHQHTVLKSYRDVKNYLASGQGGVEIGIRWPDAWMRCNGRLDSFRPGEGGHAVCFLGYDRDGWLHLANSWGEEWGERGWALVSPRAVDQMFADGDTVMIGMSDMATKGDNKNRKRDVSWIGKESVFGAEVKPKVEVKSKALAI